MAGVKIVTVQIYFYNKQLIKQRPKITGTKHKFLLSDVKFTETCSIQAKAFKKSFNNF